MTAYVIILIGGSHYACYFAGREYNFSGVNAAINNRLKRAEVVNEPSNQSDMRIGNKATSDNAALSFALAYIYAFIENELIGLKMHHVGIEKKTR